MSKTARSSPAHRYGVRHAASLDASARALTSIARTRTFAKVEELLALADGVGHGLLDELAARTGTDSTHLSMRVRSSEFADSAPERLWDTVADSAIDLRLSHGAERDAACTRLGNELAAHCAAVSGALTSSRLDANSRFEKGVQLGREATRLLLERMDRITPTSPGYLWAAAIVDAVSQRSGLPSRWNRRLYHEADPDTGGTVHPDGTLSLSEPLVFTAIRNAHTRRPVDRDTALKAVHAVHYVVHEAAHTLGPHPEAGDDEIDPIDRALHEALAEDYGYRNRGGIIRAINLDRDIPEIAPVAHDGFLSYGPYGNAGVALVGQLASVTGRSPETVSHLLLAAEPTRRWGVLADLAGPRQQLSRAERVSLLRAEFAPVVELQARGATDATNWQARRIGLFMITNEPGLGQLHATAFEGQRDATLAATPPESAPVPEQAAGRHGRVRPAVAQDPAGD
jgi:hypothetical protein